MNGRELLWDPTIPAVRWIISRKKSVVAKYQVVLMTCFTNRNQIIVKYGVMGFKKISIHTLADTEYGSKNVI